MKFRNVIILSIFFLGFFILFFCKPEPASPQAQSPEDIMTKIVFSDELQGQVVEAEMTKHMNNLTETIVTFRDRLTGLFRPKDGERDYKEMGRLFAQRGAVIEADTEKFTWLHREESIAGLFQTLPEGNLEIEIRHIFIDKIFEPRTDGVERIDMVAWIFFKYRVPRIEEGELKNVAGSGTFGCFHRDNCAWCEF